MTANKINMLLLLPGQGAWPFEKRTQLFVLYCPPILNCPVFLSVDVKNNRSRISLGIKAMDIYFLCTFSAHVFLLCRFKDLLVAFFSSFPTVFSFILTSHFTLICLIKQDLRNRKVAVCLLLHLLS